MGNFYYDTHDDAWGRIRLDPLKAQPGGNVNNDQADNIQVDISGWGDPHPFGVRGFWMYADSAYTGDAPANFDTFSFIIPVGWTMVPSTVHTTPPGGGTYWTITNASGYIINYGAQSDGFWTAADAGNVTVTNLCFASGTRLLCEDGEYRLVEDLHEGDLVMTKDNGLKPIKWIGGSEVTSETLDQFPNRRPIVFDTGVIGNDRPLRVSPQHRISTVGTPFENAIEGVETIMPAKFFVNDQTIMIDNSCEPLTYYHVMFDQHELVKSEGAWTESYYPGAYSMDTMPDATREEITFFFPELSNGVDVEFGPHTRTVLKRKDVKIILNDIVQNARSV